MKRSLLFLLILSLPLLNTQRASADICEDAGEFSALAVTDTNEPTYVIRPDGRLEGIEPNSSQFRLASSFFGTRITGAYLVIKCGGRVCACGAAEEGNSYDLTNLAGATSESMVELLVYASIGDAELLKQWTDRVADLAPTDEQKKAIEVAIAGVKGDRRFLQTTVKDALAQLPPLEEGDLVLGWAASQVERLSTDTRAISIRKAELAFVRERLPELDDVDDPALVHTIRAAGLLASALEDRNPGRAVRRITEELGELLVSAAQARARMTALRVTIGAGPNDGLRAQIAATPVRNDDCDQNCGPSDELRGEWAVRLGTIADQLHGLMPPPSRLPDLKRMRARQSEQLNQSLERKQEEENDLVELRTYLPHPEYVPLVGHRLPYRFRDAVASVDFDGDVENATVSSGEGISVVLQHAPLTAPISFEAKVTDGQGPDIEDLLPALKVFLQLLTGVRESIAEDSVYIPTVAVPWLVPQGVRVVNVPGLNRNQSATVKFCESDECEDPGEELRATVHLRTGLPRFGGVTFLLDGGANFGSEAAFGTPAYRAVGEPTAGEQLYRLGYANGLTNRFTLSILFAVRMGPPTSPDRFVIGTGPAFIPKASGGLKFQWDLRIGIRLIRGLYLTAGAALRRVSVSRAEPLGTLRSVTVGSTMPTADTTEAFVPVASIGISIDLGVLGSAASKVLPSGGS